MTSRVAFTPRVNNIACYMAEHVAIYDSNIDTA